MKLRKLFAGIGAIAMTGAALLARPAFLPDVIKDPTTAPAMAKDGKPAGPLDFTAKDIHGQDVALSQYKGKVVMIVTVARKCGFTPQYEALESIYKKYADKGFVILGFPANDFGHQEPGTNDEIELFCKSKYSVTFPMMAKIAVLGEEKAPLYKFLTEKETAGDFAGEIGWNFNKFIVDRNGNVIARYNSKAKPDSSTITDEIEKALNAKASVAMK
jgi:glutathione peroxidase